MTVGTDTSMLHGTGAYSALVFIKYFEEAILCPYMKLLLPTCQTSWLKM